MSDNRRLKPRKNAFRFGAVHLDGLAAGLECLVWDESAEGAMIEITEPERVPDRFALTIGPHRKPCLCTVVRRDGRRLGVTFEQAPSA